jgi:hypothetical protein
MRWFSILAGEGLPLSQGDAPETDEGFVRWGWFWLGSFVGGIVGAALVTLLWAPVGTLAAVAFGVLACAGTMRALRMME